MTGDAETIRRKVRVLREHCEAVGRDPAEITVSRLGTLVLTDSAEETASTRDFLRDAAGEEAAAGFNVGQDDEIVSQAEELRDAGVQYLIVNMPTSGPDAVRRAGELLGAGVDG